MEDSDLALALQLQEQFFDESNVHTNEREDIEHKRSTNNAGDRSISLVDPYWETADPSPDVRALFLEFNEKFFWGRLDGIEVKWSPRMTSCAGLCCYEGRGGLCSVRLSVPLLKLRPRKDLVETLLHEMIHAYLFVTDNNKDHDGHGPEFHKHMYRINKETGTNISVYHNFHDEVDLYKQHWWRCDGPCRSRKPYFGYVKRSMNRAPSKNDTWWAMHEQTCGGKYTKVKEPEDYGNKKQKKNKDEVDTKTKGKPSSVKSMDIRIFGGAGKTLGQPKSTESVNKPMDTARPRATATVTSGSKHTATVTSGSKHTGIVNKPEDATRQIPATVTSISKPAESVNKYGDTTRPKPASTSSNIKPSESMNKSGNGARPKCPTSNSKTATSGSAVSRKAVVPSDSGGISGWLKGIDNTSTPKESSSRKQKVNTSLKTKSSSGVAPVKKSVFHDSDFSDSDDELLGSIPLDDIVKTSNVTSNVSKGSVDVSRGSIDASKGKVNVSKGIVGASKGTVGASKGTVGASKGNFVAFDEFGILSKQISNKSQRTSDSGGRDKMNDSHTSNNSDDPADVRAMLRKVWGQKHAGNTTSTSDGNNVANKKGNSLDNCKPHSGKRLSDDFEHDVKKTSKKARSGEHVQSITDKKNSNIFNKIDKPGDTSLTDRIKNSDKSRIKDPNLSRTINAGGFYIGDNPNIKRDVIGVDSDTTKHYNESMDKQDDLLVNGANAQGVTSADVTESNSTELSTCPVCSKEVPVSTINDHLDLCLTLMAIS